MSHEAKDGRRDRRGRPDFASRGFGVETLERRELLAGNVIGGFVYHDADGNGRFDSGEAPIAGSQIELLNASGVVVGSTTTDASGAYPVLVRPHGPGRPDDPVAQGDIPRDADQLQPVGDGRAVRPGPGDAHVGRPGPHRDADQPHPGREPRPCARDGRGECRRHADDERTGRRRTWCSGRPRPSPSTPRRSTGSSISAGTSGKDFGPVPATDTKAVTLTSPGDLAAFIGTGTVSFTEAAVSNSFASGAGNLVSQVSTVASSTIDVVYHYLPQGDLKPGQYTVVQTVQPAGYSDGIDSRNGVPLPNSTGNDRIPVTLAAADLTAHQLRRMAPERTLGLRLPRRRQRRPEGRDRVRHRHRGDDPQGGRRLGRGRQAHHDDRRQRLLSVRQPPPRAVRPHRGPAEGLRVGPRHDRHPGGQGRLEPVLQDRAPFRASRAWTTTSANGRGRTVTSA